MSIEYTKSDDMVSVVSPYHEDFIKFARSTGGQFHGDKKAWIFSADAEEAVRDALQRIYGWTDAPMRKVVIIAPDGNYYGDYADRGAFVVAGVVIAQAWGRDSGARAGEGVTFLSGGCDSGGSVKNWQTEIKPNSRISVRLPEGATLPRGWRYEDTNEKMEQQKAKIARLREELAQAEQELNTMENEQ